MVRLSWPVCDGSSGLNPKTLFKLSKIAKLKVWFLGVRDNLETCFIRHLEFLFQFRSACIDLELKAKPYHTKPRHFRPVFRPFWPFFGQKTPKTNRKRFQGAYPLNIQLWRNYFLMVPLLGKFIRFRNASDYMCAVSSPPPSVCRHLCFVQHLPRNKIFSWNTCTWKEFFECNYR